MFYVTDIITPEILPTITRWELKDDEWEKVRFPLNKGYYRDIPKDASLHASLKYRLENVPDYCPGNNHGGSLPPCLKNGKVISKFVPEVDEKIPKELRDPDHQTYRIAESKGLPANGAA